MKAVCPWTISLNDYRIPGGKASFPLFGFSDSSCKQFTGGVLVFPPICMSEHPLFPPERSCLKYRNYNVCKAPITAKGSTLLDAHKQNLSAPFVQAMYQLPSSPCNIIKMRLKGTMPYSFPWCLSCRQFPIFSSPLSIHPTRLGLLSSVTIQPHPCWTMHGSICYRGDKNRG